MPGNKGKISSNLTAIILTVADVVMHAKQGQLVNQGHA